MQKYLNASVKIGGGKEIAASDFVLLAMTQRVGEIAASDFVLLAMTLMVEIL